MNEILVFLHPNSLSSVVLVTLIMRFFAFDILATTFLAIAISENLFSDPSSPDILTFQDSPQDSFASPDLPETSDLTIDNDDNDDLFTDSNAVAVLSSSEPQDSSPGLEASCSNEDEQPLNKLRSRDEEEESCSPQGPASLKKQQPPNDNLEDVLRKVKEFFGFPEPLNPDSDPFSTEPRPDPRCRSDFPHHLCCYISGDYSSWEVAVPGGRFYEYFFECYRGTSNSPFYCPFCFVPFLRRAKFQSGSIPLIYIYVQLVPVGFGSLCVRPHDVCCQFFAYQSPGDVFGELIGRNCYKIVSVVPPIRRT